MSARNSEEISHGRGGAGNMAPDKTKYVDGEIVRIGEEGDHGDGAYSTGRGGGGNIGSPGTKASKRNDQDAIPESALRLSSENESFHVGRGGQGNAHTQEGEAQHRVGLADKLKTKLFKKKVAENEVTQDKDVVAT